MNHRTTEELEAALDHIRDAPKDVGRLELVLRRPGVDEREILTEAKLTFAEGISGDTWNIRGSSRTEDGSSHPDMQLNIMNARFGRTIAVDDEHMAQAGDQMYFDFDISAANVPPGTQLAVGDAVIEVTEQPHTGCKKFSARFGSDAWRFVNSDVGKELHLRGINAKVVTEGSVRPGDTVRKLG